MTQYKSYGEFLVPLGHPDPKHHKTTIKKSGLSEFWHSVDQLHPGLSSACGIYIFGLRAGGGFTPWYVGKCNAKYGFKGECFSREKASKYEEVLKRPDIQRGTPVLFLLPRLGIKTAFAKFSPRNNSEIGWLEKEFIQLGILANSNLINRQSTKWIREVVVPGVMNSPPGRNDEPTRKLRRLLNLYSVQRNRAGNITIDERQELVKEILEAPDESGAPTQYADQEDITEITMSSSTSAEAPLAEANPSKQNYWDLPPKRSSAPIIQDALYEEPTSTDETSSEFVEAGDRKHGIAGKRRWFWMK